jgi:hypothetical protein
MAWRRKAAHRAGAHPCRSIRRRPQRPVRSVLRSKRKDYWAGAKASNRTSLAGNSPAICSRTNRADSTRTTGDSSGDNRRRSSTREGNSEAHSTVGDSIRRSRQVEHYSFGRSCRIRKGRAAVYQSLRHRLGRKVACSAKRLAAKESVAFSW